LLAVLALATRPEFPKEFAYMIKAARIMRTKNITYPIAAERIGMWSHFFLLPEK
jgi:hypothetical protein